MDGIINEIIERIERASIEELNDLGYDQAMAMLHMISDERQRIQGLIDAYMDYPYISEVGDTVAYGYSLYDAEYDIVRCERAQNRLEEVYYS